MVPLNTRRIVLLFAPVHHPGQLPCLYQGGKVQTKPVMGESAVFFCLQNAGQLRLLFLEADIHLEQGKFSAIASACC